MPLRRVLLACGATLAAGLSVQSDRGAALKLLVPQDTAFTAHPFTESSALPFKPADPSTCTSIADAANNAWCVSTCATACPPQQCKCEGDSSPIATGGTTGVEAKANADVAAAARDDAVSKSLDAAEAAKAAIAKASAAKIAEAENPAENPATPQDSFKPADPRTCKSIVAQVTDDWCISTCATACLPQQCKCEGGADTPVATTSPGQASGEPAVGSKEYLCQTHGQCDQPILPAATVPAGVADPADPAAGTSEIASATIPAGASMTDATVNAPAPPLRQRGTRRRTRRRWPWRTRRHTCPSGRRMRALATASSIRPTTNGASPHAPTRARPRRAHARASMDRWSPSRPRRSPPSSRQICPNGPTAPARSPSCRRTRVAA